MRSPVCISVAALALAHAVLISAPVTQGRMIPWRWSSDLRSSTPQSLQSDSSRSLQDQLDTYTREGRFPETGRSLETKISEADAFLERELGNQEMRVVGASVTVVYKDQVVLSKGFGLRNVSESSSRVTTSTRFQIGSVSKTFVTLGIAILVDEGKLAWNDPVIKHYPTFQLYDKYAQQYATIGDLLAMNSGLGGILDVGWALGLYSSDKTLVDALRYAAPSHSLRSEYEYANANYMILGQLIESVTGLEWDDFLQQRIWGPLDMTRTLSTVYAAKGDNDTSSGHLTCGSDVLGPYDLVTSPETQLVTGTVDGRVAAGSVVSSSDDMAKLLRLILNKGSVDGIKILKSPKLVSEMTSGKSISNPPFTQLFMNSGHHFVPEGNTLAAGYGFDFVSHALWGHAYFDKGGDTQMHHTRTGFAPDAQLGVAIMANTQMTGAAGMNLDHLRSYVMGIFLDVPADILDLSLANWRKQIQEVVGSQQQLPGVPACGLIYWKNPKVLDLSPTDGDALVGIYAAQDSPEYFGSISITKTTQSQLELRAGKLEGKLDLVLDSGDGSERVFLFGRGPSAMLLKVSKNAKGKFDASLMTLFSQQ